MENLTKRVNAFWVTERTHQALLKIADKKGRIKICHLMRILTDAAAEEYYKKNEY
jgi:hypothetical protein